MNAHFLLRKPSLLFSISLPSTFGVHAAQAAAPASVAPTPRLQRVFDGYAC